VPERGKPALTASDTRAENRGVITSPMLAMRARTSRDRPALGWGFPDLVQRRLDLAESAACGDQQRDDADDRRDRSGFLALGWPALCSIDPSASPLPLPSGH